MSDALTLVHLSDIHFAAQDPSIPPEVALSAASKAIEEHLEGDRLVLLISGDITTRGKASGFTDAAYYITETLVEKHGFEKILVCPGNHDITAAHDRSFADFNRFAFHITNDPNQSWNAKEKVRTVTSGSYRFILANTSHHGDHSFGDTPLEDIKAHIASPTDKHTILVTHHSPISSRYGGNGLTDSYELLRVASDNEITALLHGDVHSDHILTIGSSGTIVSGVGSLGFPPARNMNNQFASYQFEEGRFKSGILFRYMENRSEFRKTEMDI